MTTDIEREYDDYVCDIWRQLSDEMRGIFESSQMLEHTYSTVSLLVNQFLQDKLKSLAMEER